MKHDRFSASFKNSVRKGQPLTTEARKAERVKAAARDQGFVGVGPGTVDLVPSGDQDGVILGDVDSGGHEAICLSANGRAEWLRFMSRDQLRELVKQQKLRLRKDYGQDVWSAEKGFLITSRFKEEVKTALAKGIKIGVSLASSPSESPMQTVFRLTEEGEEARLFNRVILHDELAPENRLALMTLLSSLSYVQEVASLESEQERRHEVYRQVFAELYSLGGPMLLMWLYRFNSRVMCAVTPHSPWDAAPKRRAFSDGTSDADPSAQAFAGVSIPGDFNVAVLRARRGRGLMEHRSGSDRLDVFAEYASLSRDWKAWKAVRKIETSGLDMQALVTSWYAYSYYGGTARGARLLAEASSAGWPQATPSPSITSTPMFGHQGSVIGLYGSPHPAYKHKRVIDTYVDALEKCSVKAAQAVIESKTPTRLTASAKLDRLMTRAKQYLVRLIPLGLTAEGQRQVIGRLHLKVTGKPEEFDQESALVTTSAFSKSKFLGFGQPSHSAELWGLSFVSSGLDSWVEAPIRFGAREDGSAITYSNNEGVPPDVLRPVVEDVEKVVQSIEGLVKDAQDAQLLQLVNWVPFISYCRTTMPDTPPAKTCVAQAVSDLG